MKRLLTIMILLFACCSVYAGNECDNAFNHAVNLFKSGRFKEAKMQFEWCSVYCRDRSASTYQGWIGKCDVEIDRQQQTILRQRKAQEEARKRQEAAAIERAKRIERNRFVYLSSSSAVPGKFSNIERDLEGRIMASNPNIHFTSDSTEAYWFVRVLVNVSEDEFDNKELSCYRFDAMVDVENATSLDFETKSDVAYERGCSHEKNANAALADAANMVYDSKNCHLFERIEGIITGFIGGTAIRSDNNNAPRQVTENVVISVISSNPNSVIERNLDIRLTTNFKNAGYNVLARDNTLDKKLKEEYDYQRHRVLDSQRTLVGRELGADKVCVVEIAKEGERLFFYGSIVSIGSGEITKAVYPHDGKDVAVNTFDIDKINIVADVLAQQLGLLDQADAALDTRIREANKRDIEVKTGIKRTNVARAFVPGLAQLNREQKGQKIKGGLIIASEALTIGGIALSQSMRNINIKKMNSTNNASLKKMYADKANTYTTVRNISIGAAAAVYVWNVLDAFLYKDKNEDSIFLLNPVISNDCFAVSLSINF